MLAYAHVYRIIVYMNTPPQPDSEQGPKYNHFADRAPLNELEEALAALQQETDESGLIAYGQVARGNLKAVNDYGLTEAAVLALELLQQSKLPVGEPTSFSARYIYENAKYGPKIIYPIDSLHYSAYIEGAITTVSPILVDYPRINRRGPKGFRLCAIVNATRVMGLSLPTPELFYVPICEIQTEPVSFADGLRDCLEPIDKN